MSTSHHKTNTYKQGFYDTCISLGLSSDESEHLYKSASALSFLKPWGKFTAKHPFLGLASVAIPAAALNDLHRDANESLMTVNTLTPAQKRRIDRTSLAVDYSGLGLDADDLRKIKYRW